MLMAGMVVAATPQTFAQTASADMARMQESNAKLETEITSKLSRNHVLRGQTITVKVNGSQVTLSGKVENQKQWQEAENVAANVRGVRTILNNITIASPDNEMQAPPPPPEQPVTQQPATPASPPSATTEAGNPPPPPPDQSAPDQNAQGSWNAQSSQGASQPRPEYQGQSSVNQNGQAQPPQPTAPVTIPAGTLLRIRTVEPLNSAHVRAGQMFDATVAHDVWEGNVLAIPRGAELQGVIVQAEEPKGKLSGKPRMDLRLTSLSLGGQQYRLETNVWSSVGPNKAGYTTSNAITGGALGAILGGIFGRGPGAAAGAGLGAITGMGISSATKGPQIYIPSESLLNFHLAEPLTVQPVSWAEARRLADSVPQLQQRPVNRYYPRRYLYPYPPPPYYYSPYPYYGPSYYFGFGW